MKRFLAVMLLGISVASAQVPTINSGTSGVTPPTGATTIHNMWDDGHAVVPLQFGFPYFGKTFTNSVMYDNGVVGFFAPATPTTQAIGCDPATAGWCGGNQWSSQQFTTTLGPSWNYMIAPMHTDMRPVPGSVYSTTGDATQMTYRWQDVGEYYNPSNLNTFSLQIKPSGFIGVNYEKINIGQSNVSVGLTGDLSKGDYAQHYWKPAGTVINNTTNMIPNWNILNTGADLCATDPLSSTSCPGYAVAYLNQQCVINPLYNSQCPGYASAYFTQQCNANPLYDVNCPGYASAYLDYQCKQDPLYSTTCSGYEQAYHDQQCSINPLYATDCSGYQTAYFEKQCSLNPLYSTQCTGYGQAYLTQQCSLNPLYSTQCSGYAAAYFNQQCTANPLYNVDCPGYGQAYFNQQCSINPLYNSNCTGYTQAYHDQQCKLNPLYATDCTGYAAAYKTQQCTLNPLYATDCPGYQTAYYNQQCSLNPLYDKGCTGYAEAYALKYVVVATATVTTTTTTTQSAPPPAPDSSGELKVAIVADQNVNNVIQTSATSASPAQAATATVPLVTTVSPTTAAVEMKTAVASSSSSTKEEKKDASPSGVSANGTTQTANSTENKGEPAKPTARQELQAKREAAAKAKAIEDGKNLASNMGKAADMEAQKQVQNVVIQAMGFTPGFDAYGKMMIPQTIGYKPYTIYNNQTNVDNKRLGRGLYGPSDRLHNELVDSQYDRGN